MTNIAAVPPRPIEYTVPVSQRYLADPAYRATRVRKPKWTPASRNAICAECLQLQHETRGKSGTRFQPRTRRSLPRTLDHPHTAMTLCARHTESWRAIDHKDIA